MCGKANPLTLYEQEPRWLGRPVPRAAGDGRPAQEGMGTLRFSLGRGTSEVDIRDVAERLIRVAETMPAVPVSLA